ncbi:multiple epidermal growth factor-like domains protein 10 isoform X2 [Ptychodera flava]|uniref:multiple epidermal growth factor-like domains protein 10 isoform X2 n=1 Tax=Ptychodera flava TaxID=63121 RepID=UPI00396A60B9
MEDKDCYTIRYILCERGNAVMCDYPGEPENGETLSSTSFPAQDGETVTFVCNDGFDLSGSGTIVCEVVEEGNSTCPSGYRWNDTVPRCVPQQCEYGMYEDYCRQMCRCIMDNTLSCDQGDGTCRCKPGWTGHTCNQTCPLGWYGENCLQLCKCISMTTMHCDRYDGTCYCRDGWSGDKCDAMDDDINGFSNETSSGPPDEDNTTTVLLSDIAIAGIAICVFFVTVIVLVMIFCIVRKSRNRKKTGGEEVSNERSTGVEFDNQAYSQDEPHYATLQGNPIAEQQGTRIAVEGPYASLGETQGDVDLGLHGSEKKQP